MKTSKQHSPFPASRQALEARLTEAIDGQLGPDALRQLEKELEVYPDLKQDAALLGLRFDTASVARNTFGAELQAAFPIKKTPEARLSQIRSTLANTAAVPASNHTVEGPVFEQQVFQWFPAYVSAAALVVLALLGIYSNSPEISPEDSIMDETTLHEWIYAADLQQAFSDDPLLVDGQAFDLMLPADAPDSAPSKTDPTDEN